MNIWYFHPYGAAPGYGKYLRPYFLAREWSKIGHTAVCFVAQHHHLTDKDEANPSDFRVDGQRFISLSARPYKDNRAGRFLNMIDYCWAMLRETGNVPRPDVVIASSPHPFSIFPAWWLARKYSAKLVFEVRDIWPLSITEMTRTPRWHPIVLASALAEKFACQKADLVASLLVNADEHMRNAGMRGAFVHVPNAAPVEPLDFGSRPQSDEARNAADQVAAWKREGCTVIVHPGTQGHPSALDTLLYAMAKHGREHQDHPVSALLVGGGDRGQELQSLAAELGLKDTVAFVPPVPKADAILLTGLCDIGYAGKRNFEAVFRYGISFNKIIDFMQAGLPIVLPVTTRGDPVSASGCGIVTGDDPNDIARGLYQLVAMGERARHEMGRQGREYLRSVLSYPEVAGKYIEAIERVGQATKT